MTAASGHESFQIEAERVPLMDRHSIELVAAAWGCGTAGPSC